MHWRSRVPMLFFNRSSPIRLNLALQGGGAHGAFTWGVLDALLEDGRFSFDGVSGASAGAMNAVMLAEGLRRGGRDGARDLLATFWTRVAAHVPIGFIMPTDERADVALTPAARLMLQWAQFISPYQFNPLNLNPLREVLGELVDFDALRTTALPSLFIAATRVATGQLHLFRNPELGVEALLASACLPNLQHAVQLDGAMYWDGAFAANPAVLPLLFTGASDTLLVLLSPLQSVSTPRSVQGIRERTLELAFTAPFLREMQIIAHIHDFVALSPMRFGRLERRIMRSRFHLIEAHALMHDLAAETRLTPHLPFLEHLRDLGREQTMTWLDQHRAKLGRQSSLDLSALFG